MLSAFEEFNLYVYNSARGLVLDAVIWCLAPMIEEKHEYGIFRHCLALATAKACRGYLRFRGWCRGIYG
jgi:hypothetical protein